MGVEKWKSFVWMASWVIGEGVGEDDDEEILSWRRTANLYVFDGRKSKAVKTKHETCNKCSCKMTHSWNVGRVSYAILQ